MTDIREYIKIVESMTSYKHIDVEFRGKLWPVEVKMFNGEVMDWAFEGMGAKEHAALALTPEDTETIEYAIKDALEPVW